MCTESSAWKQITQTLREYIKKLCNTKTNIIIYKLYVEHVCAVELLCGTQGMRERKRE
jgi:hypothetical protein